VIKHEVAPTVETQSGVTSGEVRVGIVLWPLSFVEPGSQLLSSDWLGDGGEVTTTDPDPTPALINPTARQPAQETGSPATEPTWGQKPLALDYRGQKSDRGQNRGQK